MKKLLSLALVTVFALSFVAGITVSRAEADLIPFCGRASECDYEMGRVRVCCDIYEPPYQECFWDSGEYYTQWCL